MTLARSAVASTPPTHRRSRGPKPLRAQANRSGTPSTNQTDVGESVNATPTPIPVATISASTGLLRTRAHGINTQDFGIEGIGRRHELESRADLQGHAGRLPTVGRLLTDDP